MRQPSTYFRPEQVGAARWVLPSHAPILEFMWSVERERTVKQVWRAVGDGRALQTIATFLDQMAVAGLLSRRMVDTAWAYAPVLTRAEFEASRIDVVLSAIGRDDVTRWLAQQPQEASR